jgi:DNA damage-binding protein 1
MSYFLCLQIIPISRTGALCEAFNVRLDELKVLDIAFLHNSRYPTVAVLYEDTREGRHIKTYEVDVAQRELVEGPWAQSNLDAGSSLVVPLKGTAGALVVGEATIRFASQHNTCSTTMRSTLIKAYGEVGDDGSRFLLGDYLGNLMLLVVERDAADKSR